MNRRSLLAAAALALTPNVALAQTRARFSAAAAYSAERDGTALLAARNGIVIGEDYPGGGTPYDRWQIGAGTRVFAPLLIASLVQDGLMTLNEPAAMTLGDWGADAQKSVITIRALLSGASGMAFGSGPATLERSLTMSPVAAPGARFIDDPAPYVILAEIARRKLETAGRASDPATYLTERTLAPIGCVPIGWTRAPGGAPRLDLGAHVNARGWGQVGELIRREGMWRARALVDSETMRESRRGGVTEARAGMGLWLANGARSGDGLPVTSDLWRMNPPAPTDLAMAAGEGGQRLFVIPSENLVIVRLARSGTRRDWSDARFLSLLSSDL